MSENPADYAVSESFSRARRFEEPAHPYRTAFERDRDRIIHSQAFRRLEGKTQVFTPGLDDSFRNRLTHSIEVAQIGRTIAKVLRLNQTLTEAICLGHDLGHPPFGHTGEKVLNELMVDFGGFEHNSQTLRIVDLLEHPYPDFAGLNLMYESRLGLAKHKSPYDNPQGQVFSESNCSLEGQVADVADRIAYNCHDLEDGMRAGIIGSEKLQNVELFAEAQKQICAERIEDAATRRTRTAKRIIDILVSDCVEAGKKAIATANVKSVEDVYRHNENLIVLSGQKEAELEQLEEFLLENFYQDTLVIQMADRIKEGLGQLFGKYCQNPDLMPMYFQKMVEQEKLQRTVCDYIAGMTDRFCLKMVNSE